MTRMASLALLFGGLVAAITGGRVWVRFTVDDPVLGPGARTASGYAVSSALSAACIVALAAGLAALLTRRTPRGIALVVLALDAAWGAWLTVRVLTDPARAVSTSGSLDLGLTATGDLGALEAQTTVYPYAFLAAAVVVAFTAVVLAVGTSARFAARASGVSPPVDESGKREAAAAKPLPAGEHERRANAAAWDDLSRGDDPTVPNTERITESFDQDGESPDSCA